MQPYKVFGYLREVREINTTRNDNESLKEFQIRLYRNKDLYNLTNQDVGEILNKEYGNKYDESKYRKWASAYIEGWDDCLECEIDSQEIIQEIENKKDELYKQQVKTRDKLREYRKTLRDEARVENLKDLFFDCADIVSKEKPFILDKEFNTHGERVAILQLSDLHMGEIVENFLRTYNREVFDENMETITFKTLEYCKLFNIKNLKILNMGDNVSGGIHISTRVMSEEDTVFQTQYVAESIANMLMEFARELDGIEFLSVLDNHSRVNANKKEHIEKESFSKFIPWYLKARMSQVNNVKIIDNKIDDNIGVVDIFNEKALFVHGHLDKPSQVIQNLTMMTKIFPIAVFYAHLHHSFESEVHSVDLIGNPSGVGTGEYSKNIRRTSKPRQKLTIFENTDGKVDRMGTFFINL